jgi:uroporphyrinogen III methyltransferase/synthase
LVIRASSSGDRVLLFRAQEARDVLPQMLEEAGLHVSVVPAYKTVTPSDPDFASKAQRADVLTFTSASTVRGFAALLGGDAAAAQLASDKFVVCIGPITAAATREIGLHVDVVAERYTTAGLLDALEAAFARQA